MNNVAMQACLLLAASLLAGCSSTALPKQPQPWLDATPRMAVISAFEPELALLLSRTGQRHDYTVNGVTFTTGVLQGKPVVLFQSGISMVNAAMNTQLVLDRFQVTHVVFSGIAGGVNPTLHIGDVTVAQRWGQYLESVMARETAPGQYQPPRRMAGELKFPHFGMMFTRPVGVRSAGRTGEEERFWFEADPKMLEVARTIQDTALASCDAARQCLAHPPRVVVGGNGVSGQAFVDNAIFREYAYKTFDANVLDMETAATAHVAYSNGVPFIAFRSLSDLAGGGPGENEMVTFLKLAADNSAKVLLAFLAAW
ncbi:MAG: 5'-methylthioadenosine/S-adenosylhomocysteine nucleosidase [Acidovorax sp.]